MKKQALYASLFFMSSACLLHAEEREETAGTRNEKPRLKTGFLFGVGASYNSVTLDQQISASGVSDVYSSSSYVAYGQAGGPADPFHDTNNLIAPEAQAGYVGRFGQSPWLWGAKASYKYLGTTFSYTDVDSPQAGSFTNIDTSSTDTFIGHVIVGSLQTQVNHDLDLLVFFGRSFKKNYLYLGGGPLLVQTTAKVYRATGYADINGIRTDITGNYVDFSNSRWIWGGVGQIGAAHYVTPGCMLDLSYTYGVTGKYDINNSSAFTSTQHTVTTVGTLYVGTSQRITIQSFVCSINKVF